MKTNPGLIAVRIRTPGGVTSIICSSTLLVLSALMPNITEAAPRFSSVAPIEVEKLVYHGAIDDREAPAEYAVFRNSLFFSSADRLQRLDHTRGSAVDQPLPPGLGGGLTLNARFASFDGALFFHAVREYRGRRATFLYRLSSIDAVPQLVDVPEEAEIPPSSGAQSGYPDSTIGFAVYNNRLYFFADRAIAPNRWGQRTSPALFSLDSKMAVPVKVFPASNYPATSPTVNVTPAGLLVSSVGPSALRSPGQRGYGLLTKPRDSSQNQLTPVGNFSHPGEAVREGIYFDHSYFLAGRMSEQQTTSAGPFPGWYWVEPYDANDWESGLSRYSFDTERKTRYNINRLPWSGVCPRGKPCSSFPQHLLVADDVLYFQASLDSENAQLFRLTSSKMYPEIVVLNPRGASEAKPLADIDGRLWFAANTGNGYDLHLMDMDGVTPIALNVGESVARSARGLTKYKDRVVFAARDDNSDWWTYAVNSGQKTPAALQAKLTLNDSVFSKSPGLSVFTESAVDVNCEVRNNTDRVLSPVQIRLRDQRRARNRRANVENGGGGKSRAGWHTVRGRNKESSCATTRLQPGEKTSCRLTKRVSAGRHRFHCIATAGVIGGKKAKGKSSIRTTAVAYVTSQKADKTAPVLSVGSVSVVEQGGGSVAIRLSRVASEPVSVLVETVDGTAVEGDDYIGVAHRIKFEPGETQKQLDYFTWNDAEIELDESFSVVLSQAVNALAAGAGLVTILDDDLPRISLQGPAVIEVPEGDANHYLELLVTLSESVDEAVSVRFSTQHTYSADSGSDYVASNETVVFVPGSVEQKVRVEIIGDESVEDDEDFLVVLSGASDNAIALQFDSRRLIKILDDD